MKPIKIMQRGGIPFTVVEGVDPLTASSAVSPVTSSAQGFTITGGQAPFTYLTTIITADGITILNANTYVGIATTVVTDSLMATASCDYDVELERT